MIKCHLLLLAGQLLGTSSADPRERIKFDFGWRHTLLHGPPSPPTPVPALPAHCPPQSFPANASGLNCPGGVPYSAPGMDAEACATACCNDQLCAHWQFSSSSGDEKSWCRISSTPSGPACKNDSQWVGGSRPARVPGPPPGAPPAPAVSDHPPEAAFAFDDRNWTSLNVPHDMNIDQAPSLVACPYGCGGRSYLSRHSGWYRKTFKVPAEWAGAHVTVEFEGVFRHAMVYLNGIYLRNHTCGYTSFEAVLPDTILKFGDQTNVLAVYVDARSGSGWWYEGGGIYRHVWLVRRNPLHLVTWGTFVAAHVARESISTVFAPRLQASAHLNITASVSNWMTSNPATVSATFDLMDSTGVLLMTLKAEPVSVAAGRGDATLQATGDIPRVDLWTLRHPALYTVRTRLLSGTTAEDEENTTIGFRSLRYSATTGFHMNEQHFKVRGFCDHNNFAVTGMAVPERVNLFRAQAARSIGGNGRRMSHNPGAPSMFDIYDRVGMVVMDENREFEVGAEYNENLADMVKRDRNHPSITIWSFCNEQGCGASPTDPVQQASVSFRNLTDHLDGTRPTLGNMRSNDWGGLLTNETDVQGFSHSGRDGIEQFRKLFPNKPLFESECCSCNTQRGENTCKGAGCDGSIDVSIGVQSSFNADCLAEQTNASQGVPWVVGDLVWTLFDYYGEPSYGPYLRWPHVTSTFGSFDLAGFAKPAVWWFRSWWLNQIANAAADKPFETKAGLVRIVESWERPSTRPLSNGTTLKECSTDLPGQHISFAAGAIRTADGLCIDGKCSNLTTGKCSILHFVPCDKVATSQQWSFNASTKQFSNHANGGCLETGYGYPYYSNDIRDEENSQEVGIAPCSNTAGQQWLTTLNGIRNLGSSWDQNHKLNTTWCLSNGRGDNTGNIFEAVHVYSDAPVVELFINNKTQGKKRIVNPGVMATSSARSWAEWRYLRYEPGNLTAAALDSAGAVQATHTVMTSGTPAAIELSLDAPSSKTGTGSALLLDGQDVGLVRATIVDSRGLLVADATNNVSFSVLSGPGRVIGSHNGNPVCHEPNQAPSHAAYHGLVRALVQVTVDKSSPAWHRARLREIDVHSAIVVPGGLDGDDRGAAAIVVQARAAGLPAATVAIPTSVDAGAAAVLAVAAASAGRAVVFD